MAEKQGLKAVDLFKAIHSGKIKAVWIMATNPVVSLPDANKVRTALERCELVVSSDVMLNTDTNNCSQVLLPALPGREGRFGDEFRTLHLASTRLPTLAG